MNNFKLPMAKFPTDQKFSYLQMPILGLGTIWMGRRWPENNKNYQKPSNDEVGKYLSVAYEAGIRMFDTAAAYGLSEEVLGSYFKLNDGLVPEIFIATKWGEDFDLTLEKSKVDQSVSNLLSSFKRSQEYLPKIDLLYIHKADSEVLSGLAIKEGMLSLVGEKKIRFVGASISDVSALEKVVEKDVLWVDFLQTSAPTIRSRPDLIEQVFNKGIAVVVNSPIRKMPEGMTPRESFLELANNPHVSVVLTGSRTHLEDTIEFFSS